MHKYINLYKETLKKWKDLSEGKEIESDICHFCELRPDDDGCSGCLLLENGHCCNGLWREWFLDSNEATAKKVYNYIKKVIDALEKEATSE